MVRIIERASCVVSGEISKHPMPLGHFNPLIYEAEKRRAKFGAGSAFSPYKGKIESDLQIVHRLNRDNSIRVSHEAPSLEAMLRDSSVISWSSDIVCVKGIELYEKVLRAYTEILINALIQHGRFPTKKTPEPKRGHPFATGKIGLVNGFAAAINGNDNSLNPKEYMSKVLLTKILASEGHNSGQIEELLKVLENRMTGVDSEQIAWLTSLQLASGKSFEDIWKDYTDPNVSYCLHGPCTALCLVSLREGERNNLYLYGFMDADGHRSLVCGEMDGICFMASEESQMPIGAHVWRVRSGRFALADSNGWIEKGDSVIVPVLLENKGKILGDRTGFFGKKDLEGILAQDDVGAKTKGDINCENHAGRRFANAFSGKLVWLGGTPSSYAFMQFRNPNAIAANWGGITKHHTWKSSGGKIFTFRARNEEIDCGIGAGIVGKVKIYFRGEIDYSKIGKDYDHARAKNLFDKLLEDKLISEIEYDNAEKLTFNPWIVRLNECANKILRAVFPTRYPITFEVRKLTSDEKADALKPIEKYAPQNQEIAKEFLEEEWTIVSALSAEIK